MRTATWTSGQPLPRWLKSLFLFSIPVITLGMLCLGFWQLSRLQERRTQNAFIAARTQTPPVALPTQLGNGDWGEWDYRPVSVRGVFDPAQEIVWKTQAYNGAPGVHVITPLRLAGESSAVLVDRGWLPYLEAEPEKRAAFPPPTGEVIVTGLVRVPAVRISDLSPRDLPLGPDRPRLDGWFWLDTRAIQGQMPYPLLPVVVVEAPEPGATGLPVRELNLQLDDGPHLSYAVQWFSFSAIAFFGPLIYWLRERRRGVDEQLAA
jgi:surfeit locus 1 family protein